MEGLMIGLVIANLLLAIIIIKQVFTNNIQAIELIKKDKQIEAKNNMIKMFIEPATDEMLENFVEVIDIFEAKEEKRKA
jgi:hypothetical protein